MITRNTQVLLARRPVGWVLESDFQIVQTPLPEPGAGQVLVRNLYLSLDPYMRGRMNDTKSYAPSVAIGDVMVGETVGEIIESGNAAFRPGDHVIGRLGWQHYAVSDGSNIRRLDPGPLPLTAFLGVVGMPGVTAWIGLFDIGQPKPGETVAVSAASGAVGSAVGQLAKLNGCRAIGIAGGRAKCDYVVNELGFDACIDYKAGSLAADLAAATPNGIDIYFDNVGGDVLDAIVPRLNPFGRIPLCGLIANYNETAPRGLSNLRPFLFNRIRLQGFICSDTMERWPVALAELGKLVADGRLKHRESITEGLENAPRAFIGLLRGENFGKQIVKLS